jgi:hypothetical protein
VTGLAEFVGDVNMKHFELLEEAVPRADEVIQ